MKVNRIAIIGECMVELQKAVTSDNSDFNQHGSHQPAFYKQSYGGDTLNTAVYLSRLTKSHQITTSYVTGLGKDPFSHQMLSAWQDEGINTDSVYISETKLPGIYAIETTPEGERSFYYWRNDAAAKYWLRTQPVDDFAKTLSQNQVIYLSGISLAILPPDCRESLLQLLSLCRQDNVNIVFDNNYRPALWESVEAAREMYEKVLRMTDIAFLTFDDEQMLYGDTQEEQAIARTKALGVKEIVIKRGAEACYVITPEASIQVAATRVANVIDTTAAGDSFSAGYLAKRFTGGTPFESAQAGHTLAGTVIQHRGAVIPSDAMPQI